MKRLLIDATQDDATQASLPILKKELMDEILLRLPVKSLLQCRCVCKSWKSLISSSEFVKKHLHRSSTDPTLRYHRLLGIDDESNYRLMLSPSLRSLFINPSRPTIDDSSFKLCHDAEIVGSCNGLICWVNYGIDNYVNYLNPSTRFESNSPPCFHHPWVFGHEDDLCFTLFGFGYDDMSDSYKTVAIYCDPFEKKTIVKVYALGVSRSWKEIQNIPYFPFSSIYSYSEDCGRFVSNTLNWLCLRPNDSLVVVSLDIGKETFEEVSIPNIFNELESIENPKLWDLGGSLCFSYDFNNVEFVLWQMKQHGISESWMILLKISCLDIEQYHPRPFCMWDNGEVMLKINEDGKFIVYNPRQESFKYFELPSSTLWIDGTTHIESLMSPYPPCVD